MAVKPRLTQIEFSNETKDFKSQITSQMNSNFQKDSITDEDKQIINSAYEIYMKVISGQSILQQFQFEEINELDSQSSSESLILQEDGGPALNPKIMIGNEKLIQKFVKAISKKLQNYSKKLAKDLANTAYIPLIMNLNIQKIQWDIDAEKRFQAARQPIKGENKFLSVLERIYLTKHKFDQLRFIDGIQVKKYSLLLQDKSFSQKIEVSQNTQRKNQIRRGFLLYPESQNLDKINPEILVNDPANLFQEYIDKIQFQKKQKSIDFDEIFDYSRISAIYNLNSTIFEVHPTTKVAFIKNANQQAELALPIITKIKNKELILSDYRLELGHFIALQKAFEIDPNCLTKITLNNCGVDNSSFCALLRACMKLKKITYIQLTKGSFGTEAINLLKQFFQQLDCLDSLKFKDVELQPTTCDLLFQSLSERSYIRVLQLPNFTFSEKSFEIFTQYFAKNQYLEDLNISNVKGLRLQSWITFMEVLSHNRTLTTIDLSINNFIENQEQAQAQLQNPHKIFDALYEKFLQMGPGSKWPGENNLQLRNSHQTQKQGQTEGPKRVTIPEFNKYNNLNEIKDRYDNDSQKIQELLKLQQENEVAKLIKRSLKIAFMQAFQRKIGNNKDQTVENKEEVVKQVNKPEPQLNLQIDNEPKEFLSQAALVITEAIFKFIRRNNCLQHLNLTRCNLSQVMIGRIGLGVKCSNSLMGVHFCDNPGVTPALKAFLQVKFKARLPQQQNIKISNQFIEQDANLSKTLESQIKNLQAESSLAHEAVAIRDLNKKRYDCSHISQDINSLMTTTLIFTRLIAHKHMIPNSGRWKILTKPQHECWICQQHVLSLVFWSPKQISKTEVHSSLGINKERLIQNLTPDRSDAGNPILFGQFTNWQPQLMMKVKDFSELPRKRDQPNFFAIIKRIFNLGQGYNSYEDLDQIHITKYNQLQEEYQNDTKLNWRRHIASFLRWKDPQLINYEFLNEESFQKDYGPDQNFNNLQDNPIYVHATLMKPGKQYYVVQYNEGSQSLDKNLTKATQKQKNDQIFQQQSQLDNKQFDSQNNSTKFYLHKVIVPLREFPLPQMNKNMIEQTVERVFNHNTSVFAPWKPDNASTISKCTIADMASMNLSKLIKTPEDLTKLQKVINQQMPYLKSCHQDLLCDSNIPPFVSVLDFVSFYRECNLTDQNLQASSIDLIYVQVDTNAKSRVGINRGEFIEALIRIAKQKYVDTGLYRTVHEALKVLIEQNIKPTWGDSKCQQTRQTKFWTIEVNDLIEANLDSLKKIYMSFWDLRSLPKKKWMDLKEADYFTTQLMPNLRLNVKLSRKCYFMSKMTCEDEEKKLEAYNKLQFVEFLELLCRIALEHFEEGPYKDLPLVKRLEIVLDNVLAINGLTRRAVQIANEVDSDADVSDGDY